MDAKLLFTVSEAAERLGLGRTLVYALVLRGDIQSVTVGRCRRVPAQALEEFVQERLAAQSGRSGRGPTELRSNQPSAPDSAGLGAGAVTRS